MQLSPRLACTNQGWWENNSVERNVVFAHKLEKFNVLFILPPLLPFFSVKSCNWDITNWCIKPNIEHFITESFKRYRRAPLKVSRDTTTLEASFQHSVCEGNGVWWPIFGCFIDPLFQLRLNLGQVNKNVLWLTDFRSGTAARAFWFDELCGVYEFATTIALVTFGIREMAHRAFSTNESVSEETLALKTELLIYHFLKSFTSSINVIKNILCNYGLLRCTCATKAIKVAVKPFVDFLVDCEVMITNFFAGLAFLHGFSLSGSSVLISTANIDCVVPSKACVSCKYVRWQNAPNDVAQMGYVIDIRQCTGNQNVTLTSLRQNFFCNDTSNFCVGLANANSFTRLFTSCIFICQLI